MELWHWHPVFVHFAVALLFTAPALFIVYAVSGRGCGRAFGPGLTVEGMLFQQAA